MEELEEYLKENGFTSAIKGYWSGRGYSVVTDKKECIVKDNLHYVPQCAGSPEKVLNFLKGV